jgi:hypothetical protein
LLELPDRARDNLLGGDSLGTLLFGVSLVGAIVLMHRLASVAFGETERRNLVSAMALLVLVVVAMVGTRQRARHDKFSAMSAPPARIYAQTCDLGLNTIRF